MTLKIPPPLVMLSLGGVCAWWTPVWPPLFTLSFYNVLAALFLLGGAVISALGVLTFRRAKTTVNPLKPHTASTLVTQGIYRYSRNPMYVGLLLVLAGWALYLQNLVALLIMPTIFVLYINKFQIAAEERALVALFGDGYIEYMRHVRRWV